MIATAGKRSTSTYRKIALLGERNLNMFMIMEAKTQIGKIKHTEGRRKERERGGRKRRRRRSGGSSSRIWLLSDVN